MSGSGPTILIPPACAAVLSRHAYQIRIRSSGAMYIGVPSFTDGYV